MKKMTRNTLASPAAAGNALAQLSQLACQNDNFREF
jgi:hypothetical protein